MLADEILVTFRVTDHGTFVWFLEAAPAGAGVRAFYKIPESRGWLRPRVVALRNVFNRATPDALDATVLEEIFRALFPADYASALLAARNVVVVPDDCLFLLPVELLSPSASKHVYPLAGKPIRYFPSVAAFTLARTLPTHNEWTRALFAIGDPLMDPPVDSKVEDAATNDFPRRGSEKDLRARGLSLDPLPGTRKEIEEIAKLFSGAETVETRLGAQATKKSLVQKDLSNFRFLHLATHGLLPTESNLVEPALVFSRDPSSPQEMFLQLSEVLQLRVTAESVVLSACNTGSGSIAKAEGVSNLGRAFLLAGASSATVSLWEVADDSTAILMREYYRGILAGRSKPEALASARVEVIKAGFSNPFYWAAFVLMGN